MKRMVLLISVSLAGALFPLGTAYAAHHKANSPLSRWEVTNHGALTKLAGDIDAFDQAAANTGSASYFAQSRADAETIELDTEADFALPPIPNPADEGHWAAALAYFESASEAGIAGIDQSNLGVLEQANTMDQQGRTQLVALAKALKK